MYFFYSPLYPTNINFHDVYCFEKSVIGPAYSYLDSSWRPEYAYHYQLLLRVFVVRELIFFSFNFFEYEWNHVDIYIPFFNERISKFVFRFCFCFCFHQLVSSTISPFDIFIKHEESFFC